MERRGRFPFPRRVFYLPTDPGATTGRSQACIVCLLGAREHLSDGEGNLFDITEMKRLLTLSLLRCRL